MPDYTVLELFRIMKKDLLTGKPKKNRAAAQDRISDRSDYEEQLFYFGTAG